MHAVPKPHPLQKFCHVFLVIALMAAHHTERKGNILPGSEMIEKPEILKNDSNTPPKVGALACRILGYISSEKVYKSARGAQRHVKQPEKGGFAGAGSSG